MASSSSSTSTAIFLQDACHKHRFIRSRDISTIVERPERLRAVATGLACAIARIEEISVAQAKTEVDPDELASQLGKLDLKQTTGAPTPRSPVTIVRSSASLSILDNPAVKYIHGDIDGDVYLENLVRWVKECEEKIEKEGSEIPGHLAQGDLYLCPESLEAIEGALGTVCEAVDAIIEPSTPMKRAFVTVRPPGHHCGEDTPSGFCFVNNVAVAAAHAHLSHGIDRIVIFDIDLHHGNGTQSIAWQINEETYRQTLESEGGRPPTKRGPRVYYSSIHDILSYPCEDGKPALVQAASTSLRGPHGQYIENVHLQEYTSPEHFDKLYEEEYSKILRRATDFLDNKSTGKDDDVLVFISCGMDASEHELPSMSRHNRRVPTAFFHRFARDACAFADKYARGRLVSVLEGGYSDRALASGAMAHLVGLADPPVEEAKASEWWSLDNLILLEKATKKKRGVGGRQSLPPKNPYPWLDRAVEIFSAIDGTPASSSSSARAPLPPSTRTLRERKNLKSATPSPAKALPNSTKEQNAGSDSSELTEEEEHLTENVEAPNLKEERKLPRVILKLGPAP
ncbi:Arginase/deacetylase [Mycena amicta]|nr:Arginase/deacetylase [Mycena amicta]